MVEPFSLNFRVFTVKLVGVRKFRSFTVNHTNKLTILRICALALASLSSSIS